MHIDWGIVLAGAIVGFTVGMTGMGGGALMTPILVIFFGVTPSAAVSSDLVAAMIMKPIGGGVHIRRRTVRWQLVAWLCIGSIPMAFAGVFIIHNLGDTEQVEDVYRCTWLGQQGREITHALAVRDQHGLVPPAHRPTGAAAK